MQVWKISETIRRNSEIMDMYLGRYVQARLISPTGSDRMFSVDRLIYNEGAKNMPEGYYLRNHGIRLLPSQFIGAAAIRDSRRPPVLSFGCEKPRLTDHILGKQRTKRDMLN